MSRPNENTLELLNPEALDHDMAELFLRTMSWSRFDCYNWCPKQYMYKYVEFMEEEGFVVHLALGSAVHDALENCVKKKCYDEIGIEGWYQEALMEYDPDKILSQDEVDSGYNWIFDTMNRLQTIVGDDFSKLIDVEWGFKYIIGSGLFRGYVDLIFWDEDKDGKFIHIVDYKTGNNEKIDKRSGKVSKKKRTKKSGQMMLYTLAAKAKFPGERIKASLYWTRHDDLDTHEFNNNELKDFKATVRGTLATIFADQKFNTTPDGIKCAFCAFARDDLCRYGVGQAKKFSAITNARNRRQGK